MITLSAEFRSSLPSGIDLLGSVLRLLKLSTRSIIGSGQNETSHACNIARQCAQTAAERWGTLDT